MLESPEVMAALIVVVGGGTMTLYLGRPGRAARNEGRLASYRDRSHLQEQALRLGILGTMLVADIPAGSEDAEPEVRARLMAEHERLIAQVDEVTVKMLNDVGLTAGTYVATGRDLIIAYITTMRGVVLSARPDIVKGEILRDCSIDLLTTLGPGWRVMKRGESVKRLKARLGELNSAVERPANLISES